MSSEKATITICRDCGGVYQHKPGDPLQIPHDWLVKPDPAPKPYIHQRYHFVIQDEEEKDIATASIIEQAQILTLTNVWTKEAGLAGLCVQRAIETFGHKRIMLHVQPFAHAPCDEQQLIKWYESFGFVQTEVPYIMVREPV